MGYDTAVLRSGYALKDQVDFSKRIMDMLYTNLDIDPETPIEAEPEDQEEDEEAEEDEEEAEEEEEGEEEEEVDEPEDAVEEPEKESAESHDELEAFPLSWSNVLFSYISFLYKQLVHSKMLLYDYQTCLDNFLTTKKYLYISNSLSLSLIIH